MRRFESCRGHCEEERGSLLTRDDAAVPRRVRDVATRYFLLFQNALRQVSNLPGARERSEWAAGGAAVGTPSNERMGAVPKE